MKKRIIITAVVCISIILLILGGIALKFYVIGHVGDVSAVIVKNIEVTDKRVSFDLYFATSADIMNWYTYRLIDNTLYIKLRSVIAGGISFKNRVNIKGDFSLLQQVILEDNKKQRVIWTK